MRSPELTPRRRRRSARRCGCRCGSPTGTPRPPSCSPSTAWSTGGSTSRSALGDWSGALARDEAPLVRPHSECLTGDVFGSQRCDCGPQLREAVERIATAGGLAALPAPGGAGHRPVRQARRVRPAGRRTGHLRGQPRPRARRGRARLHASRRRCCGAGRVSASRCSATTPTRPSSSTALGRDGRPSGCRPAVHLSAANAGYLAAKARPRDPADAARHDHRWPRSCTRRRIVLAGLTVFAVLLVFVALVLPDEIDHAHAGRVPGDPAGGAARRRRRARPAAPGARASSRSSPARLLGAAHRPQAARPRLRFRARPAVRPARGLVAVPLRPGVALRVVRARRRDRAP